MRKLSIALGAAVALVAAPAFAQGSAKIGFVDTFSGPTAVPSAIDNFRMLVSPLLFYLSPLAGGGRIAKRSG